MEQGSEELRVLRQQRMAAIKDCEFKQARHIDHQMTLLKQQISRSRYDDKRRSAEALYESEKDTIKSVAATKYSEATESVYQAKIAFQRRIQALDTAHAERLKKLAEENSKELELSQTRTVPEARILKHAAQTSAVIRNYDAADMFFDECNATQRETVQVRQDDVKDKYETKRQQLEEQHESERRICRESYKKQVEDIMWRHRNNGKKLDLRLGMRAHTLRLPIHEKFEIDELQVGDDDEAPPKRSQSTGGKRLSATLDSSPQKCLSGSFSPRPA